MSNPTRTRIMLEINGVCSRGCPTCLPASERTGEQIPLETIKQLAADWKARGITQITLAGFGNPVQHPEFGAILLFLASRMKFKVAVVCRPEDVEQCWAADQIVVSIDNYRDVQNLLVVSGISHPVAPSISTHTLLTSELKDPPVLDLMLGALCRNPAITRINFAEAVVLSSHPDHVAAIKELNRDHDAVLARLEKSIGLLPWQDAKFKVTKTLKGHFPDKCAFHHDLIYVDAALNVRPCCHCPTDPPLANIEEGMEHVEEAVQACRWNRRKACQRCPDLGL